MSEQGQFVRIGFADGSQTSGFKIEGRGEIVGCVVKNEQTPFADETSNPSGVKCGYAITVQYLDANWNPTEAEPVTEFLSAGPVEKFHPGHAEGPTSPASDLGEEPETEGNVLLCGVGKEPNKNSKLYKFGKSCQDNGLDKNLFDGYAPNLIGLKANFWQQPQPRGQNQKEGSQDPTCLAIKQGEVFQKPGAKTSGAATSGGAKAKAKAAGSPAVSAAPTAPVADDGEETITARTLVVLQKIVSKTKKEETIPVSKLIAKATVTFLDFRKDAENPIPTTMDKAILANLKNAEWLGTYGEGMGVVVSGDTVTLPAGAGA